MGTNYYLKGHRGDDNPKYHIGKRSAAGLYCWDCHITLCKGGNLEFISIISVGTNGALYVERLQRKRGFTMGLLVGNSDLTSSLLPPRLGFARAHRLPGRANWEEFRELLTNMDASSPGGSSYKCYRSALFSLLTYAGMNSSNMVEV